MYIFKKAKLMMPYVIRGENMRIIGIREDAPEEAKEAFKEYMEIEEAAKKDGCRL